MSVWTLPKRGSRFASGTYSSDRVSGMPPNKSSLSYERDALYFGCSIILLSELVSKSIFLGENKCNPIYLPSAAFSSPTFRRSTLRDPI